MNEEEKVEAETTENTEVEAEATETKAEVDWKAKAEKAEEIANNQRIRAEKAEKLAKEAKPVESEGLSQKDVIYLAKAEGIHEDDIDEVVDLAKLKKITVAEAHKYMKPILNERNEERKTALATQTKGGSRGTSKVSPADLIAQAEKGNVPESLEDIDKLAEARMAQRNAIK